MNNSDIKNECQLTVEPFFICCCNCKFHVPVNYHCCTSPKPPTLNEAENKPLNIHENLFPRMQKCVCNIPKGWACVMPYMIEGECIHDNWPEHSCGCEMYTEKT